MRSVPVVADATIPEAFSYHGFAFRETAAAVARITIHNGTSNADPVIDVINLAASASDRGHYSPPVDVSSRSIFVDVVAGAVSGVVRVSN